MLNSVKPPFQKSPFPWSIENTADQPNMIQDKGQLYKEVFVLRLFQPNLYCCLLSLLLFPYLGQNLVSKKGSQRDSQKRALGKQLLESLTEMSNASFTQALLSFLPIRENHWQGMDGSCYCEESRMWLWHLSHFWRLSRDTGNDVIWLNLCFHAVRFRMPL